MTRRRRNILRVLLAGLALVIAAALLSLWLARSNPSWYRAVQLTEAEQVQGQQRLLDRLATLRNEVGRSQLKVDDGGVDASWPAFQIELHEAEVNATLMRWASTEPNLRTALSEIEEPHVRFLDGRIEVAGRSRSMGSLVNIELSVTQAADGSPRVELGRPWAGRMPLSRALIEEPAEKAIAGLRSGRHVRLPTSVIDALEQLVQGETVAPIVAISSSASGSQLLAARVEKLTIEDGVLKATLRPVK